MYMLVVRVTKFQLYDYDSSIRRRNVQPDKGDQSDDKKRVKVKLSVVVGGWQELLQ
jgi:hypothetical protein